VLSLGIAGLPILSTSMPSHVSSASGVGGTAPRALRCGGLRGSGEVAGLDKSLGVGTPVRTSRTHVTRLFLVPLAVLLIVGAGQSATATFDPDPVFPVGPISGAVSHEIVRLDDVVSAVAGRRATVNCWSTADWRRLQVWQGNNHRAALIDASGLTFPATNRIQLSPAVCEVLARVIAKSAQQPLYTAWAVTTLAHESAHASGIRAESRAECRAITTEPRAAQLLGIPKATAEKLQRIYRGTIYPYGSSLYRTPVCTAGQPGMVAPDTLGDPASLRPLKVAAKHAAPSLPRWRNIGGAYNVGPLSPCAPITSRTLETARFDYTLLGPRGEFVAYSSATAGSERVYATALERLRALPRCDLQLRRTQIREAHSANTVSLSPMPNSISRLSSRVRAFRERFTSNGKEWNLDSISVFDHARRMFIELFFSAPVGRLDVTIEVRAVAAILRASS
jgi:hypothetical protein